MSAGFAARLKVLRAALVGSLVLVGVVALLRVEAVEDGCYWLFYDVAGGAAEAMGVDW